MEHIKNSTKLIGIKDLNIKIALILKHQTHIEIRAELDYPAPACPHCQGKMIKYDFQRPATIPILDVQGMATVLKLRKRRFQCKACRRVSVAKTSLVKKHCQISQPVWAKITQLLIEKQTNTDIARRLHVSVSTVQRQLNAFTFKDNFETLPEVLSWDEFARNKGKLAFIAQDFKTKKIIALLENNRQTTIKKHFYKSIPSYTPYLKISETTQDTVLFLSNFVVTSADTNTDSITDLYFSSCYAFLTPYRFFNIWRVASEISFSVWCVLYDIQNSMENVLPVLYKISPFGEEIVWNVSCREMNDHYPHVTASNGYTRPPPSKRNPLYTSKHYIKYLLWLKKNANSSSGDSIIRLSIDNVNVSAYVGDVPIEVSVGVMGSETLPSISFFFRDVCLFSLVFIHRYQFNFLPI